MPLPKLAELLKEKTTFVLGAGASKDFNMPLWGELRDSLQRCSTGVPSIFHHEALFWERTLRENPNESLNDLAMHGNPQQFSFWKITVGNTLLRVERDLPKKPSGWIDDLAKQYVEIMIADPENCRKLSSNLRFITLNYDRVFDFYFPTAVNAWFNKIIGSARTVQNYYDAVKDNVEMVYHPHGCLGGISGRKTIFDLPINKPFNVPFGASNDFNVSRVPPIFPVRDFDPPSKLSNSYQNCNKFLKHSKNCVCIGLSPEGINASKLAFPARGNVYYSGKQNKDLPENFEPLDLHAVPLVSSLSSG